jgi:hypothetical protein
MASLIERHRDQILGVLSCLDRVVIRGTSECLPRAGDGDNARQPRYPLSDYVTQFAQPFREAIRAHAEHVAAEEGVEVEYIKKPKGYRKEDRIPRDRRQMRCSSGTGARLFGDGALFFESAVARQQDGHDGAVGRLSRVAAMVDAARTIRKHWHGVLRWFTSRITNGLLQGINSLIQAAKAKAFGYRTSRNLIAMVYLLQASSNSTLPTCDSEEATFPHTDYLGRATASARHSCWHAVEMLDCNAEEAE